MASLNVAVFKDSVVAQPVAVSVECMATCGENVLLVGTADGKIAVYDMTCAANGQWDAQMVHLHSAKHQRAFHTLIPVPERGILFAATADAIAVLRLPPMQLGRQRDGAADGELLAQVSAVTGLKDVTACSARRHKGSLLVAALVRRRVLVYQYAEGSGGGGGGLALFKESASLPEGARCMAWTSKGLLIGFRKEYFMLHLPAPSASAHPPSSSAGTSAHVELLYDAGNTSGPFLLSMDPVPEVLVGVDGACCRALPDGSLIGSPGSREGGGGIPWAGGSATTPLPTLSVYAHPYLLVGQAHGSTGHPQRVTIEVYLPVAGRLCQTMMKLNAKHLSCRGLADLDKTLPTKSTPPEASRPDLIVALDEANRLHVLSAAHAAEQARAFASAGHFEVSELLCQLCPNEVPRAVRSFAATLCAASEFAQGSFAPAMQRLRDADAHPMLAAHLFGDALLSPSVRELYTPPKELEPLIAKCVAAAKQDAAAQGTSQALSALMQYLLTLRLLTRGAADTAVERRMLGCVDTVLLKVMALLGKEQALQDLLADTNWCHPEESAAFLRAQRQWVALAALWRAGGHDERALHFLRALAAAGREDVSASTRDGAFAHPLPKEVVAVLRSLVSAGYAVHEDLTPQSMLAARIHDAAAGTADGVPVTLSHAQLTQTIGILSMLSYMRGLSLVDAAHRRLFEAHAPWLLSHLPNTQLSLSIFFSPANRRHYREAFGIIQTSFRAELPAAAGGASRLAVVADFQAMVLGDAHLAQATPQTRSGSEGNGERRAEDEGKRVTAVGGGELADIHAGYWQNLALLVFGGAADDPTPVAERRRQLDSFLLCSPHIDCEAAEEFFEDAEIRAASRPERAIVYRRLGRHEKALDMLLDECDDLEEAKAYCSAARRESGDDDAYLMLFRKLFQKEASGRSQQALDLLRSSSTGESGSAPSVLPMLPDDLPVRDIRDYLINSLRQSTSTSHSVAFHAAVLAAQERQLACLLAAEESRGVLLTEDGGSGHVCAVCHKRLRPETAFLLFPNGVVAHVGCVEDRHICPVTGTDFRTGVVPSLIMKK